MAKTQRADQLVVEKGYAPNRDQAARLIMAGTVSWQKREGVWLRVDKPGELLPRQALLHCTKQERFVSRGGYKLLTALETFALDVSGSVALDIGASTGGFTDCLLQHGGRRVYAVDVGYGQLHWRLRRDERVVNLERVNFRLAPLDLLPESVDLVVADCSFISLRSIIPPALPFLKSTGAIVALVKPQFESATGRRGDGVVRDATEQQEIVETVSAHLCQAHRLQQLGVVPAAVTGPKGNQEFLLWLAPESDGIVS
ncbi:MAG: TlyA family RNA methyltransferase [Thermodesulfobacteriota bacterium]